MYFNYSNQYSIFCCLSTLYIYIYLLETIIIFMYVCRVKGMLFYHGDPCIVVRNFTIQNIYDTLYIYIYKYIYINSSVVYKMYFDVIIIIIR